MGKKRRDNRNRSSGSPKKCVGTLGTLGLGPTAYKTVAKTFSTGTPEQSVGTPIYSNRGKLSYEQIITSIPTPRVQSNKSCRLTTRRNDPYYYTIWRNAYGRYLRVLFDGVQNLLNLFKVPLRKEISFDTFSIFIYNFSSGYITPYA
jgi:hypothetical protein